MKLTLALCALAVLGLLAVPMMLSADEKAPVAKNPKMFGKVKSVDAEKNTLVVTSKHGEKTEDVTLTVTTDTKITDAEKKDVKLADIKVDQMVRVEYTVKDDGKTAASVMVMPAKEGKKDKEKEKEKEPAKKTE